MKNVILCCSAGMSTSLLVTKMNTYIEKLNKDIKIWAIPIDKLEFDLEKVDLILLAPQIRYLEDEILEIANPLSIPVEVINMVDYGNMKGENVIKRVIEILQI